MIYHIVQNNLEIELILEGQLKYHHYSIFIHFLKRLLNQKISKILVNLHRVEHIDLAGLGMLFCLREFFEKNQVVVEFVQAQNDIQNHINIYNWMEK